MMSESTTEPSNFEGSERPVGRESPRAQINVLKGQHLAVHCPPQPIRKPLALFQSFEMGSRGLSPHRLYEPSGHPCCLVLQRDYPVRVLTVSP